ncbi:MAG: hypothetical protein ABI629_17470 [bacterium]
MRRPRKIRRLGERGISLIETIVALGLLAFTAATMSSFLVTQIRQSSNNTQQTRAYALAEEELESIRAQRFNDMSAASKTVTDGVMVYTVVTAVTNNTPASGLKTINVNVTWKDPTGPRNVLVSTIYTEVRRF